VPLALVTQHWFIGSWAIFKVGGDFRSSLEVLTRVAITARDTLLSPPMRELARERRELYRASEAANTLDGQFKANALTDRATQISTEAVLIVCRCGHGDFRNMETLSLAINWCSTASSY
jgi:hypothetical protein